jgi:iron complex outermembrane receptor protein
LAARYEKYSDYGSDFAPKASLSFTPIPSLKLRASAGKGFRAPQLDILNAKETFSAEAVIDAPTAVASGLQPNQSVQVNTFFKPNPALQSEQSTQYALGAVWDVSPAFSVKIDYWSIEIDDVISSLDGPTLVNRDNGTSPLPIPAGLAVTRDPVTNAIVRVDAGYANEGTLETDGIDLGASARYKIGSFGQIGHELSYTHVLSRKSNGTETIGTYGLPEGRLGFATTWTLGGFEAAWNVNVIGKSEDPGVPLPTYTTHDVQVTWNAPWRGRLTVGAVNLFEKLPVVDEYSGRPFYFDLYDYYGRQVYVRYTQSF